MTFKNIFSKNILLLAVCTFLLFSKCQNADNYNTIPKEKRYFDLQKYIATIARNTQEKNPLVKKSITDEKNKTISQDLHIKNWDNELHLFLENNLNKPVLFGQYEVVKNEKEETYTAKKQGLHTQKLIIKNISPTQKSLEIQYNDNNYLYHAQRILFLETENNLVKNYLIRGEQKGTWIADRLYEIKGEIK